MVIEDHGDAVALAGPGSDPDRRQYSEVVDVMSRRRGQSSEAVVERLGLLEFAGLDLAAFDAVIGTEAAVLRARYYEKRVSPLSLADCVALAAAKARGDDIATSDPPLAIAARRAGVAVIALPDSEGRRPTGLGLGSSCSRRPRSWTST